MTARQRWSLRREQQTRDVQLRRQEAEASYAYVEVLEQEVWQITESVRMQWLGDRFAEAIAGSLEESPGPKGRSRHVSVPTDGCAL